MLSILSDEEFTTLSVLTHKLGMHVLTEVSNEEEVQRALALNANIIGINNRNLRDLSTDLATTERLVPLINKDGFDGVILSESGIYKHSEIQRLSPLVDGFLVGSALMAEANLINAVEKLIFGEIKICGINSVENARKVMATPASYMGLIFATKSPRYVSLERAMEIASLATSKKRVGVFLDNPIEVVADYARKLTLAAVQLHGNESIEYMQTLRTLLPESCEIWAVESVLQTQADLTVFIAHTLAPKLEVADKVLLDCKIGDQVGGTGATFNWRLLEDVPQKHKLILAGGLAPSNIQAARKTQVAILDVNSGVEESPAEKSESKLSSLFASLREY
jgi:indole-3-glycerol phosphate synthase/phosphoribosylanthranilate isomerase